MVVFFNPNPLDKRVGDCVVRAIAKALDQTWQETFIDLCLKGLKMGDMPSSNAVWNAYLLDKGFERDMVKTECPECYTMEDFASEFNQGSYVVGTGKHAVSIVDGNIYDAWDSSKEQPLYFYYRKED